MARTTKQLSGAGKDKFLRGLIASEPGLPSDAADALGEKMCSAIADVRVRRDAWEESKQQSSWKLARSGEPNTNEVNEPAVASEPTRDPISPTSVEAVPTATDTFDPFAFSALAVLAKKGRAALAKQLAEIDSAEHLYAIAVAQHLAVDLNLNDLGALREALIAATEARLAERRAAAS